MFRCARPEAYVTTLFDQHAEVFDKVLVEDLGYHVPLLLRQRLIELGKPASSACSISAAARA
jgi:predicted TPR repeat methyltransferase